MTLDDLELIIGTAAQDYARGAAGPRDSLAHFTAKRLCHALSGVEGREGEQGSSSASLPASPDGLTEDQRSAGGGHLDQLSRLFGKRAVRFSVPGRVNGRQTIEILFADASLLRAESDSVEGAWNALLEEADRTPGLDWDLEQRVFHAANSKDVPEVVRDLIRDLWKAYCAMEESAFPAERDRIIPSAASAGNLAGDEPLQPALSQERKTNG